MIDTINQEQATPEPAANDSVELTSEPTQTGQGEIESTDTVSNEAAEEELTDDGGQPEEEPSYEVSLTDDQGQKVTEKVPASELVKGYMRDRDYRHKTTMLATRMRDAEQVVHNDRQTFYTQATQRLQLIDDVMSDAINRKFANVDWEYEARNNPEFNALRFEYESNQTRLQAVKHQRAVMEQEQAQQDATRYFTVTRQYMPDWSPEPTNPINAQMLRTAAQFGFTAQDIANNRDPRIAVALRVMSGLSEKVATTQTNIQAAKKKVVNAPPVLKPQSTRAQQPASQGQQAIARSRKAGGDMFELAKAL